MYDRLGFWDYVVLFILFVFVFLFLGHVWGLW